MGWQVGSLAIEFGAVSSERSGSARGIPLWRPRANAWGLCAVLRRSLSALPPQASPLNPLAQRDIGRNSSANSRKAMGSRKLRATSPATKPRRRDMAGRIRSAACGVPSATTARDSMRRFRYPARHACAANHAARGDLSGAHQSGRAPGGAHRGWDPSRLFLVRACPPNGVARTSFMQKTERREQ